MLLVKNRNPFSISDDKAAAISLASISDKFSKILIVDSKYEGFCNVMNVGLTKKSIYTTLS